MAFWIPLAIMAASAIAGSKAGSKDRKKARDQARLAEGQLYTAEEVAKQQRELYTGTYLPVEKAFGAEALYGLDPNYEANQAAIGVQQSFARAPEMAEQGLRRQGVNASSPRSQAILADIQMARALAETGARTGARANAKAQRFGRLGQVAQLGRNIPSQNIDAANSAAGARFGLAQQNAADAASKMQLALQLGGMAASAYGGMATAGGRTFSPMGGGAGLQPYYQPGYRPQDWTPATNPYGRSTF